MFHVLSMLAGFVLTGFVIWEVAKSHRDYRRLKQAVAQGDPEARARASMRGFCALSG